MIYIIVIALVLLIIFIFIKQFTNKKSAVEFISKTNNGYRLNSAVIANPSVMIDQPVNRDIAWYNTRYNAFSAKNNARTSPLKSAIRVPNTNEKTSKRLGWRNANITRTVDNTKLFPFINMETGKTLESNSNISNVFRRIKKQEEKTARGEEEKRKDKASRPTYTSEQVKDVIKFKRDLIEKRGMLTPEAAHETAKMLANVNVYKGSEENTDKLLRLDNAVSGRAPFNYITGKKE